jgi:hypothetical protein
MGSRTPPVSPEGGDLLMPVKNGRPIASVPADNRPSPVRVKLQRKSCDVAKVHPPDGDGKVWWSRLKKALGVQMAPNVP